MIPRVKICGFTQADNLIECLKFPISAVGFVLAPSKRQVSLSQLEQLSSLVPPGVTRVAVTVDPKPSEVENLIARGFVDYVQLHGSESPEFCIPFGGRIIKAISIRDSFDPREIEAYQPYVSAYLFDAYSASAQGGTGTSFNWDLLKNHKFTKPYFLAGGLGPNNVALAQAQLNPWGLDMSSSVESSPGLKSPQALQAIFEALGSVVH